MHDIQTFALTGLEGRAIAKTPEQQQFSTYSTIGISGLIGIMALH